MTKTEMTSLLFKEFHDRNWTAIELKHNSSDNYWNKNYNLIWGCETLEEQIKKNYIKDNKKEYQIEVELLEDKIIVGSNTYSQSTKEVRDYYNKIEEPYIATIEHDYGEDYDEKYQDILSSIFTDAYFFDTGIDLHNALENFDSVVIYEYMEKGIACEEYYTLYAYKDNNRKAFEKELDNFIVNNFDNILNNMYYPNGRAIEKYVLKRELKTVKELEEKIKTNYPLYYDIFSLVKELK
ncbi:hypothetical protein SAMN06265827_12828 [Orenia metallireducens]|uniref:Uncharacterized protein n=1 Tax=Orenia metallireducens TaxID=1413210 RepID=A0A285I2U9_9FIRM|nr:hypothetical protein [Orenia metallireducens]SNY41281.1 hypothetical protein SAMN06265827_12828 [Orenia metallireducens]